MMQAMAVAPLDKQGVPDLSQMIVISYAGTNPGDWKDVKRTCARLVVLGQNGISWFSNARVCNVWLGN